MKRSAFHKAWLSSMGLISSVLIICALAVTIIRIMVPSVPSYRQELQDWLSVYLGHKVKIENLGVKLNGLDLIIRINEAEILAKDNKSSMFQLQDLRVSVDLMKVITDLKVEPETIDLIGLDLSVERDINGKFVMQGLSSFTEVFADSSKADVPKKSKGTFIDQLSGVKTNIRIVDSTLLYRDAITGKIFQANRINLILGRDDEGPTLSGAVQLPSELGDRLRFYSKLTKRQSSSLIPSVEFYLQGTRMKFHNWPVISELKKHPRPVGGDVDMQFWGEFDSQEIREIQGRILGREIEVEATNKKGLKRSLKLDKVDGDFAFTSGVYGWKLDAANLQVVKNDNIWGVKDISAWTNIGDTSEQRDIGVTFNHLQFNDSNEFVEMIPGVDDNIKQKIKSAALSAKLKKGVVFASLENGDLKSIATDLTIDRFSIGHGAKRFYSTGIDYRILATEKRGLLRLSSESGTGVFATGDLFRKPFKVKTIEGDISWSIDANQFALHSYGVDILNQDISAKVRFDYNSFKNSLGVLDLQANVEKGDATSAPNFYPAKIMGSQLLNWLDNAFLTGEVTSGKVLVYGELNNFPYNNKNGIFEVDAIVKNVDLDFHPAWGNIDQADARLLFHNNGMDISILNGKIGKTVKVKSGYARIKSFRRSPLEVKAKVHGNGDDYLSFLKSSPLEFARTKAFSKLGISGETSLDLGLEIPLVMGRVSDAKVNGILGFNSVDFNLEETPFFVDDINGTASFNHLGAIDSDLSAKIFGEDLKLNVYGKKSSGGGIDTMINAEALVDLTDVIDPKYHSSLGVIDGKSLWGVSIKLPNSLDTPNQRGLKIKAKSDLVGTTILLPQPMSKISVLSKKNTELSMNYMVGDEVDLVAKIDGVGSAKVRFADDSFGKMERGQILLGSLNAKIPNTKGMQIYGSLKSFNLDLWKKSLETLVKPKQNSSGFEQLEFSDIKVDIGRLIFANRDFNEINAILIKKPSAWRVQLTSDRVNGWLLASKQNSHIKKIKGVFEKLDIQSSVNGKKSTNSESDSQSENIPKIELVEISPQEIPALDLVVEKLFIDGQKLGSLNFISSPIASGMQFERIDVEGDILSMKANGSWLKNKKVGERTHFQANMNSSNVGAVFDTLGQKGQVKNGNGKANYDVYWQGSPWEADISSIEGTIEYEVSKGQLLKIEPGFGRMIGIFSIETLWRRMIFDFRDIFSEGFAFDLMKGSIKASDGNAYINNFQLKGVAATVDMEGRIGLRDKDLDQIITITPKASSALPLVGGLAAGTGVGLGILILQKVFQSPLEKMSSINYKVTGSWDDPKMEKYKVEEPPTEYEIDDVLEGV